MQIIDWNRATEEEKSRLFSRPSIDLSKKLKNDVETIVLDIADRGDKALFEYALRFDGVDFKKTNMVVTSQEIAQAYKYLDPVLIQALHSVIDIVSSFTETDLSSKRDISTNPHPGLSVRTITSPIPSCALYVPFGKGSFPSMVYMQGIPAQAAGVPFIHFTIPPDKNGAIDPACLVAAHMCGIESIYKLGGAHAIAAFAHGTQTVPKVAKILGPGSTVVSLAKQLVSSLCDTGSYTGPSESCIICDAQADPEALAGNLLIEAEHGPDSLAVLISSDRHVLEACIPIVVSLIDKTPEPRQSYLRKVIKNSFILVDSLETACTVCTIYAPEHLQLQIDDPESLIPYIHNAGEILIGEKTPFSLANYAGGTSAVLPTSGFSKSNSALSVHDFRRVTAIVEASPEKTKELRQHTKILAQYEGFHHHARIFDTF